MLTLPRHHIPSLFQILRAIVCSPDFIGINMSQCSFYDLRLKPLLIENSLSNLSHTMRYKDIFRAHTFQRHVCRLTVHWFQWIAITGKNVWSVFANRLHNFQYDKCLLRQWNNVHAFNFHTPGRNAPLLCFKLISSHRGIAASAGRVIVKSCHSIWARVYPPIFMQLSLYIFELVRNHPTTA